jgi:hypothetical protein
MTTNAEILSSFAVGDELRLQADSCRQLAGLARTERNKLVWLRLAKEWLDLASSAERHRLHRARAMKKADPIPAGRGMITSRT